MLIDADEYRPLDTNALQGLAHPLRVQLLEQLQLFGPATATQLAARLNESSGATSYHLRQLARYGFVEEDSDQGTGRERWWRRVERRIVLDPRGLDDVGQEAAHLIINEWARRKTQRLEVWRRTYDRWPAAIVDASVESTSHFRLTAEELEELARALEEVTERFRQRQLGGVRDRQPGYLDVEVQLYSFPVGEPPEPEDA